MHIDWATRKECGKKKEKRSITSRLGLAVVHVAHASFLELQPNGNVPFAGTPQGPFPAGLS